MTLSEAPHQIASMDTTPETASLINQILTQSVSNAIHERTSYLKKKFSETEPYGIFGIIVFGDLAKGVIPANYCPYLVLTHDTTKRRNDDEDFEFDNLLQRKIRFGLGKYNLHSDLFAIGSLGPLGIKKGERVTKEAVRKFLEDGKRDPDTPYLIITPRVHGKLPY